jgi:hypothetical protein
MYYNARWYDPGINHFVQTDNIPLKAGNTEGLDRFAYVSNNPINHADPTGHDQTCTSHWDDHQQKVVQECHDNVDDHPKPLCQSVTSSSVCQKVSKMLGMATFIIDLTSTGLSSAGVIVEVVGALGGPEGITAAVGTYGTILNPIENTLGATSFGVNTFNDAFITGETYIKPSTYGGAPSLELVAGSDTSISFATSTLGISPEAISDTVINGGSVAYDAYRLGGGKELVETHIILAANLTLHFESTFPFLNP